MQPVGVIEKAIEIGERRGAGGLVMAQAGAVGMKIPLQRPRPHGQARTGLVAVTVLHSIQGSIQMVVDAIHSIRRTRRLWAVIGGGEVGPVARHLGNRLGHRPVEGGARPLCQAAQALGELRFRHGVIDAPGSIEDLATERSAAAFSQLNDGVQETEHQGKEGKELVPRIPRCLKPVRAHGARRVCREDRRGFGLKLAVGVLQLRTRGLGGNTDAQHTAPTHGGRDHHFFPCQPSDFLIGHQILGHLGSTFDGGPDQIGPPQTQPRPIPKHGIAPKDIRQRVERHAPLAQGESFFNLFRPRNAIGQQKGGAQREHLCCGPELNPAQPHALFPRAVAVVEGIALSPRLGKQFRVLRAHRREIGPVLHHVLYPPLILGFTRKGHADMFVATGWRLLLFLCVVHHSTVWQILARPSPLFFSSVSSPQNPLERETLDEFRVTRQRHQ
jgi:hypothetical protein